MFLTIVGLTFPCWQENLGAIAMGASPLTSTGCKMIIFSKMRWSVSS